MIRKSSPSKPTVIELFAGVGGFRIGLDKAGWQTVWSNQWEPSTKAQHASSCYIANFGSAMHSNVDIAEAIDNHIEGSDKIPKADMIVGGFPCQDYSVAKSLRSSLGLKGKKGVLWWEILRLVSIHKPKIVFLENVDRLLKSPSNQRGRDFAIMLRTLGELGYFVEWRVVNAADYGFAQRRIRVFIVAASINLKQTTKKLSESYFDQGLLPSVFRFQRIENMTSFSIDDDAEKITKTFNQDGEKSPFLSSGAYLGGKVITANAIPAVKGPPSKLGDVLVATSQVPDEYWIDPERLPEWEFLKGGKKIERVSSGGHTYTYSEGAMAFPDDIGRPSRTILTGEGGSTPSRFKHVIKTRKGYRRLVPVELERLNGFPDNWTKFDAQGKQISDARRAFFMGNALVVGLVEMVGREIKKRYF